jgi:DNA-binding beta-propeller fold protein YncE
MNRIKVAAALIAMLATPMASAANAKVRLIGTIAVPGEALDSFDISFVDQEHGRYYLADRTNKSLDIFDANTSNFVGRVPGFIGFSGKNTSAGPNGVSVANGGAEAWVGDGDSTVKVVDLKSKKIIDTISTGGKFRADEVASDPRDGVFIVANDADEPPFVTLISTKPGHKIIGKIVFDHASDGIEQPQYNPDDGMFYVDIPQIDKDKTKGALAVIDPRTAKLVKMLPVEGCIPHGLAVGKQGNMLIGCNAGNKRSGLPGQLSVFDARKGAVVTVLPGPGGSDESNVDNKSDIFYSALGNYSDGPTLAVIDAKSRKLLEMIPTGAGAHSVAVNEANHRVFVPVAKAAPCGGCIMVFGPE